MNNYSYLMNTQASSSARRRFLLVAIPTVLAAVGLAYAVNAAHAATASAAPAKAGSALSDAFPDSQPASVAAIKKSGHGVTVGPVNAAREVFVFFDPKCPHCAHFWQETQALRSDVKFTWLPVAFMGPGSATQGASLLAAGDPSAAMSAHASGVLAALQTGVRVPQPESNDPTLLADVDRNSRLLTSFGGDRVPFIVAATPAGSVLTHAGGMPNDDLVKALGLPAPAASAAAKR